MSTLAFPIVAAVGVLTAIAILAPTHPEPNSALYTRLARETEANLRTQVMRMWYPRAVDSKFGGFKQDFDERWQPTGSERDRSIVYQSRLTWTAATVSIDFPDMATEHRAYALHGLACLRDAMWDMNQGGFYWQIDAQTKEPSGPLGAEKHLYGEAFGIYAAATVYRATKEPAALDLATRAFRWLDQHAHDSAHSGYFEQLSRDGRPLIAAPRPRAKDAIGTEYGLKSMNSHIHLLEALTELYAVWPDPLVRNRLEEVFHIVRDRIYSEPGYLNLYFKPDWTVVPDHDSCGHDVETAYLLVEAAAALGISEDRTTWIRARRLVDHALKVGWDDEHGGFYDYGPIDRPAERREKIWWTEAEGLNALLLLHERFDRETPRYWQAFEKQWAFIKSHQLDPVNGGWRSEVMPDGAPISGRPKSDAWTECYHQGRALMNVTRALRRLAGNPAHE